MDLSIESTTSKILTENDVFLRESEFLKLVTIKNEVDWAPKFYDYINNELIVLEDLSERGFQVTSLESFDLNHCYVALNTIASFNAFSFKYVHDKKLKNQDYSILKEYPFFFEEPIIRTDNENGKKWIKSTRDSFHFMLDQVPQEHVSSAEITRKFNEKYDQICDYFKPVDSRYNVISHGDLWGNNIMFSYEKNLPQKCCLVDFQLLRYLPPTNDLQILLAVNTTIDFRKKHLRELLDYYYARLTHELINMGLDPNVVYPKDIFETSCRNTIIPALIMTCFYKSILLMDREKFTFYMKDNVLGEELIFGDRVKFIKQELERDAVYKQKLLDEIQEFINEILNI